MVCGAGRGPETRADDAVPIFVSGISGITFTASVSPVFETVMTSVIFCPADIGPGGIAGSISMLL
jgi:hypothetical protein